MNAPETHVVHKALHRTLGVWGVDRRLFFFTIVVGALQLRQSVLAGLGSWFVCYLAALWVTKKDPQMPRIIQLAWGSRTRYDSGKHAPFRVEMRR